ncbi:hypothetical protein GOARA_056_01760 [Gordonia araii NBRC 100433]|uniref:DUF1499 domain-containing protein n=1 Tax=Gordonia araii NBRC 100433 TaxID=1073574 RepID=G7H3K3_9ACTN|nr:hypothetical protein [Gordonia araii]NNG96545.1 hypothetical protein [Gordonia araii NBRC 100433]GAB10428.1 hypothetical protein GOARA_056_01760 [Gordonia araii NBRC 100433]
MPTSRTADRPYAIPPDAAFAIAAEALRTLFGSVSRIGPTTLEARSSLGWASWGEIITVDVQAADGGSLARVHSRSALPTQFLDWGKHAKNLSQVFSAIDAGVGSASGPPFPS